MSTSCDEGEEMRSKRLVQEMVEREKARLSSKRIQSIKKYETIQGVHRPMLTAGVQRKNGLE